MRCATVTGAPNLAGLPQRFLTPAELARQRRARPGDLWLGWGFDWSSDHAQLALDLIRAGPHRLVPGDADTLGRTGSMAWPSARPRCGCRSPTAPGTSSSSAPRGRARPGCSICW
ncbi:MAG: hypothetical protein MZU95_16270 [Desulfomicrobium escambiense]|nr:hypothetical protein [Desulfomicrobium escambiense]